MGGNIAASSYFCQLNLKATFTVNLAFIFLNEFWFYQWKKLIYTSGTGWDELFMDVCTAETFVFVCDCMKPCSAQTEPFVSYIEGM